MYLILVAKQGCVPIRVELLLGLAHQGVQPCLHIGQFLSNVAHQNLFHRISIIKNRVEPNTRTWFKVLAKYFVPFSCSRFLYTGWFFKFCFRLQSLLHGLFDVDILLTAVHDTDEPKLERVDAASENISSVRSCIHQIEFGQNADGSFALWVDQTSEFERVGVGEIDICRYGKNHAVGEVGIRTVKINCAKMIYQLGFEI